MTARHDINDRDWWAIPSWTSWIKSSYCACIDRKTRERNVQKIYLWSKSQIWMASINHKTTLKESRWLWKLKDESRDSLPHHAQTKDTFSTWHGKLESASWQTLNREDFWVKRTSRALWTTHGYTKCSRNRIPSSHSWDSWSGCSIDSVSSDGTCKEEYLDLTHTKR